MAMPMGHRQRAGYHNEVCEHSTNCTEGTQHVTKHACLSQGARGQHTCMGTCTTRLGPGCQATMAICFWMVATSGGLSSRSVL